MDFPWIGIDRMMALIAIVTMSNGTIAVAMSSQR